MKLEPEEMVADIEDLDVEGFDETIDLATQLRDLLERQEHALKDEIEDGSDGIEAAVLRRLTEARIRVSLQGLYDLAETIMRLRKLLRSVAPSL